MILRATATKHMLPGDLAVAMQLSPARRHLTRIIDVGSGMRLAKSPGGSRLQCLSNSPGNRRRAVLLPLGLLMLSLAVFGWGLQYKLSLYQGKDSISHQAPVAKLLSQKERPASGQALSHPVDLPTWPIVLIVAVVVALCPAAERYLGVGIRERYQDSLPPCLQAIFLRPPPVVSFSL